MKDETFYLNKIDNQAELTEKELDDLVFGYSIENSYGENARWTRPVESIVQLQDRYFLIKWEEGLTEYQENEFLSQPEEVERHTYEKVIKTVVNEWIPKTEDKKNTKSNQMER